MSEAIRICGVAKSYGKTAALHNINLSVSKGELFGLIGPDGAGKTTLYKILATLQKPDSGSASISGLDTVRDAARIRTKIGYMPEKFSLYPDLTVEENLKFFASVFGVEVNTNSDLIAPIFRQLKRFPHRKAGALSGGMKQKLALSCALIHRPDLLLLDEPTTGVDAVSRTEFWDMLGSLRRMGITILASTSYMDEATRCERIAMINRGRILDVNTPAGLTASLGENLFNASATDMFSLLGHLRKIDTVADCYTFGATLHLVAATGFDPDRAAAELQAQGLRDVRITPAQGNIEDLFIKLTRNDEN